MSQLSRLLSCGLLALAVAASTTAHAQDLEPEPEPGKTAGKSADAKKDGAADDKKVDGAAELMSLATYPARRIDRPRVLPHMTLEAQGELVFSRFDFGGASSSFTVLDFGGGLGFLQGKAEAGLRTGLVLDPDTDLSKQLELYGAYSVLEKPKYAVAGELKLAFNFNDGADSFGGFSLGARGIYRLNDKMALLGGSDFFEWNAQGDSLDINLNVGFLYQFTTEWSAEAHTQLASLGVAGDLNGTTVILADATPVALTGYWTSKNKLDVWASFRFDINNIGDFQQIAAGIAYRFGL